LAHKGVTRDGEAYCLKCKSSVDATIERCPSCDSVFQEEVKAFFCPRCNSLLTLGTSECPQCGMKFRVKAVRSVDASDDVDTSAEKESTPEESPTVEGSESVEREGVEEAPVEPQAEGMPEDKLELLRDLVGSLTDFISERGVLMERMAARTSMGQTHLDDLHGISSLDPRLDLVEASVSALREEMMEVAKLHSTMLSIANEVSAVSASLGMEDRFAQKGLAAKALELRAGSSGTEADELRSREEQVARREDMVDRKIKGYAQKKKELDDREAELSARSERIQREQSLLEETRASSAASGGDAVRESEKAAMEREVIRRLLRVEATLKGDQDSPEPEEGMTMDDRMSSLEMNARKTGEEREEVARRMREIEEDEDEVRRLLRTLDQLLGQLPESAVQQFTQSEDYKLYERVLDRLKI
jgi:hypothetical protein